jgi:hypothetical protein
LKRPLLAVLVWPCAGILACEPGGVPAAGDGFAPVEALCEAGAVRPCYEGAAATAEVGSCRGGSQICEPHGRAWGRCEGQVLPRQEQCGDLVDDDCDGLLSCGETLWSLRAGTATDEVALRAAGDAEGNAYVVGYYRDPIDLGDGALESIAETRAVFAAKLAADGQLIWSRGFFAEDNLTPRGLAPTSDGGLVVAATARGTVQIAGQSFPGATDDVLIARLDAAGGLVWLRRYGDDASQHPSAVAIAPGGDVLVSGYARGVVDFGGGDLSASTVHWDAFALRLTALGEHRWSRLFPGEHDQIPRGLAVDQAGAAYLVGDMQGSVDFGGGTLLAAGDRDAFVLGLDAEGEHLFSLLSGDAEPQQAFDVAVDPAGDLVVVGRFEGTSRWGQEELDAAAAGAIFVVKLAPDGAMRWARRLGGPSNQGAYGVACDSLGRIAVAGFYDGDIRVGETDLGGGGVGEPNILLVKLTAAGAPIWARGVRVDGEQAAGALARGWRTVAFTGADELLLAGFALGRLDLGDGETEGAGGADLLLARLAR